MQQSPTTMNVDTMGSSVRFDEDMQDNNKENLNHGIQCKSQKRKLSQTRKDMFCVDQVAQPASSACMEIVLYKENHVDVGRSIGCSRFPVKPTEFIPLEKQEWDHFIRNSENPSARNESWCRNRFDAWRAHCHMDCSRKIEEIPLPILHFYQQSCPGIYAEESRLMSQ
ncbi:hypothetical protein O6H91_11G064300 [Diphasiastrum complanatum]|uniref:Uncharacterized protein n=1 Tax=Diphasiastrum complanatum TaxID=34168 RepID=A0ACC2CAB3_DIPCM|nr:hypothetical protein O6H91_11G064300 [Diphasiastrum complanatum]